MTYTTISGDSWDLIAYKIFGNERYAPELMAVNPKYVATFIFEAGVELNVPTIESAKQSAALPWKK